MKIIKLQGENFKKMTAFDITPTGNTIIISGKNGQGKTSVLDSIVLALAGGKTDLAKLTTKPIKEGAETASVTVTTEDYVITRTWTKTDSYLTMTNPEGLVYKSPQAMLDKIIGDLCFDPLEFSRLKAKDQREELLGIVKLEISLEDWEQEYANVYEQRKQMNARKKELEGKLATMETAPEGTPEEEVSVSTLSKELMSAMSHNDLIENDRANIAAIDLEIVMMEERVSGLKKKLKDYQDELVSLGEKKDISALNEGLANGEAMNRFVRAKKDRDAAETEKLKYNTEALRLDGLLGEMEKDKRDALLSASFPIAGLSVNEDGVTFKDIPFAQLSSALQLKVSMAIAMAKNPKLRVIRITDGSLLDEDNMKALQEMGERNDFQIWVEKVDSSGKVGVVIHDGEVVSTNP